MKNGINKILLSSLAISSVLFTGCSEEKIETKPVVKEENKQVQSNTEVVTQATKDIANTVTVATNKVIENIKNDETIQKTTQKVVESTKEMVDETVKTVAPVVSEAIQNITASQNSLDGKKLFATCAACHGANGEKKSFKCISSNCWMG